VRELQQAVREADAGDFAMPEEVGSVLSKWGVNGN
jgi:predicted transcriptional regulator